MILRLIGDRRISLFLKAIPIGSLLYMVFPADFLPFNPVDDALIVWLGTYLFVELCPQNVVEEHLAAIRNTIAGKWTDPPAQNNPSAQNTPPAKDDVVDGEFREVNSTPTNEDQK